MATYHTDYLLGNDTTGDGSAALPFKTITKAYTVAVSDDTIKVAGSSIVDVPGLTLTCTNQVSFTYTSNIDPTGLISVGDVISLTEPNLGSDKFFFRVVSITGTTIVLNAAMATGVSYSVRKFSQIHYYTTTSITFESPVTTGKLGIQLLGGWNSDFTIQDGWTVASYQGTNTATIGTFLNGAGQNNTYYEKFCFVSLATGIGGGTTDIYFGDMIGSRTNSMFGSRPLSKVGYKPKFYINSSNCQTGTATITNADGSFGLQLSEFYYLMNGTSSIVWSNCGFSIDNVYTHNANADWNNAPHLIPSSSLLQIGDVLVSNYVSSLKILGNNNIIYWDGTLTFTGSTTNPSLGAGSGNGTGTLYWNNPTQNVGDFKWWPASNNPRWTYSPGQYYINDIEGTKMLLGGGLTMVDRTEYVTGSSSLKIGIFGATAGQNGRPIISQFMVNDTTTSLTITLTAKQTVSGSISFFVSGYGLISDVSLGSKTIDTTFGNHTFTITGDNLTKLKNKMCVFFPTLTNGIGGQYLWVDDVVITQS